MGTREAEHEEQLQRVAHALPPAPPPPGEADGDEDDEEYELESDFDVEDSDSDEDEEDVPPEENGIEERQDSLVEQEDGEGEGEEEEVLSDSECVESDMEEAEDDDAEGEAEGEGEDEEAEDEEVAVAEQLPLPSQQHPPGVPGHQPAEGSAQASMPSHSNAQGGPNHAAPQATCSSVPGSAYPTRAATPLACTGSIAAPELLSAQAVPTQPPGELTGPPTSLPGQEQQQQQQVQAILLPAQGQFPSQPGAFVDGEEQGASASALQAAQQQQQDQLHQQELSLQQQQDALLRDYGQQLCGGEAGQQPQQMQSQGEALALGLPGDTLNGGAIAAAAAAADAVAAEGGSTPGPGPGPGGQQGPGDGAAGGWVPPSGICRRTRAHVSLRDVEWDVLEQQLPEHVDMEELELAEDDEEYGRFLQALFDDTSLLPDDASDSSDPDFLADLDMDELDGDQDLEHEQRLGQRGEHLQAGAQGCPEGQAGPWMRLLTSPGSPGGAGAAAGAGVDSPSRYTRARGRRQDDAGGDNVYGGDGGPVGPPPRNFKVPYWAGLPEALKRAPGGPAAKEPLVEIDVSEVVAAGPEAFTDEQLATLHAQVHCHCQMLVQVYALMARDPDGEAQELATKTLELIQGIDTARVNNSLCRQGSGYPAYTPQQLSTPPGTDAASGLVFSRLTAANAGTVGLMPDWSGGGAAGGAAGGGGRDYDDDSESDSDGDGDEESDGEDGAAEGEEGGNAGVDPGTAPKRKRGRKPKRAAPKSAAVRNRVAVKAAAAAAAAACKATLGPSIRAFRPAFGEAAAALPAAASDADGSSGGGGGGEAEAWSVLDVAPLRLFSQVQAGLLALPPLPHSMLRAQRELQLVRKSTRKHRRAKSVDPLLSTLFHVQPALQCLQAHMLPALLYTPFPPKPPSYWSVAEDELLAFGIAKYGNNWLRISECLLLNRNRQQIANRYKNLNARRSGSVVPHGAAGGMAAGPGDGGGGAIVQRPQATLAQALLQLPAPPVPVPKPRGAKGSGKAKQQQQQQGKEAPSALALPAAAAPTAAVPWPAGQEQQQQQQLLLAASLANAGRAPSQVPAAAPGITATGVTPQAVTPELALQALLMAQQQQQQPQPAAQQGMQPLQPRPLQQHQPPLPYAAAAKGYGVGQQQQQPPAPAPAQAPNITTLINAAKALGLPPAMAAATILQVHKQQQQQQQQQQQPIPVAPPAPVQPAQPASAQQLQPVQAALAVLLQQQQQHQQQVQGQGQLTDAAVASALLSAVAAAASGGAPQQQQQQQPNGLPLALQLQLQLLQAQQQAPRQQITLPTAGLALPLAAALPAAALANAGLAAALLPALTQHTSTAAAAAPTAPSTHAHAPQAYPAPAVGPSQHNFGHVHNYPAHAHPPSGPTQPRDQPYHPVPTRAPLQLPPFAFGMGGNGTTHGSAGPGGAANEGTQGPGFPGLAAAAQGEPSWLGGLGLDDSRSAWSLLHHALEPPGNTLDVDMAEAGPYAADGCGHTGQQAGAAGDAAAGATAAAGAAREHPQQPPAGATPGPAVGADCDGPAGPPASGGLHALRMPPSAGQTPAGDVPMPALSEGYTLGGLSDILNTRSGAVTPATCLSPVGGNFSTHSHGNTMSLLAALLNHGTPSKSVAPGNRGTLTHFGTGGGSALGLPPGSHASGRGAAGPFRGITSPLGRRPPAVHTTTTAALASATVSPTEPRQLQPPRPNHQQQQEEPQRNHFSPMSPPDRPNRQQQQQAEAAGQQQAPGSARGQRPVAAVDVTPSSDPKAKRRSRIAAAALVEAARRGPLGLLREEDEEGDAAQPSPFEGTAQNLADGGGRLAEDGGNGEEAEGDADLEQLVRARKRLRLDFNDDGKEAEKDDDAALDSTRKPPRPAVVDGVEGREAKGQEEGVGVPAAAAAVAQDRCRWEGSGAGSGGCENGGGQLGSQQTTSRGEDPAGGALGGGGSFENTGAACEGGGSGCGSKRRKPTSRAPGSAVPGKRKRQASEAPPNEAGAVEAAGAMAVPVQQGPAAAAPDGAAGPSGVAAEQAPKPPPRLRLRGGAKPSGSTPTAAVAGTAPAEPLAEAGELKVAPADTSVPEQPAQAPKRGPIDAAAAAATGSTEAAAGAKAAKGGPTKGSKRLGLPPAAPPARVRRAATAAGTATAAMGAAPSEQEEQGKGQPATTAGAPAVHLATGAEAAAAVAKAIPSDAAAVAAALEAAAGGLGLSSLAFGTETSLGVPDFDLVSLLPSMSTHSLGALGGTSPVPQSATAATAAQRASDTHGAPLPRALAAGARGSTGGAAGALPPSSFLSPTHQHQQNLLQVTPFAPSTCSLGTLDILPLFSGGSCDLWNALHASGAATRGPGGTGGPGSRHAAGPAATTTNTAGANSGGAGAGAAGGWGPAGGITSAGGSAGTRTLGWLAALHTNTTADTPNANDPWTRFMTATRSPSPAVQHGTGIGAAGGGSGARAGTLDRSNSAFRPYGSGGGGAAAGGTGGGVVAGSTTAPPLEDDAAEVDLGAAGGVGAGAPPVDKGERGKGANAGAEACAPLITPRAPVAACQEAPAFQVPQDPRPGRLAAVTPVSTAAAPAPAPVQARAAAAAAPSPVGETVRLFGRTVPKPQPRPPAELPNMPSLSISLAPTLAGMAAEARPTHGSASVGAHAGGDGGGAAAPSVDLAAARRAELKDAPDLASPPGGAEADAKQLQSGGPGDGAHAAGDMQTPDVRRCFGVGKREQAGRGRADPARQQLELMSPDAADAAAEQPTPGFLRAAEATPNAGGAGVALAVPLSLTPLAPPTVCANKHVRIPSESLRQRRQGGGGNAPAVSHWGSHEPVCGAGVQHSQQHQQQQPSCSSDLARVGSADGSNWQQPNSATARAAVDTPGHITCFSHVACNGRKAGVGTAGSGGEQQQQQHLGTPGTSVGQPVSFARPGEREAKCTGGVGVVALAVELAKGSNDPNAACEGGTTGAGAEPVVAAGARASREGPAAGAADGRDGVGKDSVKQWSKEQDQLVLREAFKLGDSAGTWVAIWKQLGGDGGQGGVGQVGERQWTVEEVEQRGKMLMARLMAMV